MDREFAVTHPERVLFGDDAITKGELVDYYLAVAGAMLPLVAGRPVTLQRFPNGLGGPGFYQKQAGTNVPDWIQRVRVPKQGGGTVTHLVLRDAADLAWIANQSCITPHVWLSRIGSLQQPDLLVFDLDPASGAAGGTAASGAARGAGAACLRQDNRVPRAAHCRPPGAGGEHRRGRGA